ncbi:Indoleamine 2,3-dioxygenase [Ramaria rubella]|nr:Indoleamine 2,3-dioxygenase [Ramaria rubella]
MSFVSPVYPRACASFIRGLLSQLTWSHDDCSSKDIIQDSHVAQLRDFEMDAATGFLPDRPPLDRLPAAFDVWERALASAPDALSLGQDESPAGVARRESSRRWRLNLQSAPILSTESLLVDVRYLRRAHHVLAFLVHFYMHSLPPPSSSERLLVPASLAIPLVSVSDALGIAPILTFADTVLWNWALIDPSKPLSPENIRSQTLFTKGHDEQNFYVCCASIELRGVEALRLIIDYNNISSSHDPHAINHVANSLDRLSAVVDELTSILKSVRATCDPHAFYFGIRPWFRGSDANGPDSPGWVYEGIDPSRRLELSGPSAGQSSTMHALDVFLDVDHQLSKPRLPAPSDQNRRADHSFMTRMRKYMPGKHQAFLCHLASHRRPVRELARCTPVLRQPYDSVVLALKRFRDQHMRIACLYVVSMSRSSAAMQSGCPIGAMMETLQQEGTIRKPVRGTGGNELSCLLKASRDATSRTVIEGNIS